MVHEPIHLEAQWVRLGVLFNCDPAPETPDLERLLLATAHGLGGNARLLPLVVTWLVENGHSVAKHRLKKLVTELKPRDQAALGLIIESAIELGAPVGLRIVSKACSRLQAPEPLFDVYRSRPAFETVARQTASSLSQRWGLWAPPTELKREAIRPAQWLLSQNPSYEARVIRKGDLRCSILVALRHDAGGRAKSEAAVAQLCSATRLAVRKALDQLVLERGVTIDKQPGNNRDKCVTLRIVA